VPDSVEEPHNSDSINPAGEPHFPDVYKPKLKKKKDQYKKKTSKKVDNALHDRDIEEKEEEKEEIKTSNLNYQLLTNSTSKNVDPISKLQKKPSIVEKPGMHDETLRPPEEQSSPRLFGLENSRYYCYLNSCLQCLFTIPEFRRFYE